MIAYILNIVAFVFVLAFAIYGTLYVSGQVDKWNAKYGLPIVPQSKWALFNTICYWMMAFVLFLLLFI